MRWNIVTDSSCDLLPEKGQGGEIQISSVPFVISVGSCSFIDNEELDTLDMVETMERQKGPSYTACPSPQGWRTEFEKADCTIALTISSQLSGSMNSAMIARNMVLEEHPEKRITVLDSCSTGPELVLAVKEIRRQIECGTSFEDIVTRTHTFFQKTSIDFALCSFDNLVKSGRISKFKGLIARKLGLWGIGAGSTDGRIVMQGRERGAKRVMEHLLAGMKENGFHGGEAAISHCHNPDLANKLKNLILNTWRNSDVTVLPTRGLCSYYAERGGLILAY